MDRLDAMSVFAAIVDGGSLAEGARRMRRSPAAVTRCLNAMEARLGVRLIERTTRWIAPTEAGRRLVEHARKVLDDYQEALHDIGGDARNAAGVLRVTAPLAFGRLHLAPVVAGFLAQHPQVKVELVLSNAIVDLRESGIDLALRIGHLADSSLVAKAVGEVRHLVVGSRARRASAWVLGVENEGPWVDRPELHGSLLLWLMSPRMGRPVAGAQGRVAGTMAGERPCPAPDAARGSGLRPSRGRGAGLPAMEHQR